MESTVTSNKRESAFTSNARESVVSYDNLESYTMASASGQVGYKSIYFDNVKCFIDLEYVK